MDKRDRRVAVVMIIVTICVVLCLAFRYSAAFKREVKSIRSDMGGGLNRTVTVYDYNGGEIDSWTGKFDVTESDNEVYFDDENGKRVIIHGGIVINEEN